MVYVLRRKAMEISIHALREEGDLVYPKEYELVMHFYPRPPRGGRLSSLERAEKTR